MNINDWKLKKNQLLFVYYYTTVHYVYKELHKTVCTISYINKANQFIHKKQAYIPHKNSKITCRKLLFYTV